MKTRRAIYITAGHTFMWEEPAMTIVIKWIDHDGVGHETACFDEHHAMMLEDSLAAEGLHHERKQQ